MWCCFLLGTIGGAYVEDLMIGQLALLVPASITFIVGTGYMFFRQTLKDYIKRVEKARLEADMRSAHKALAHTANRLHDAVPHSRQASSIDEEDNLMVELDEEMG